MGARPVDRCAFVSAAQTQFRRALQLAWGAAGFPSLRITSAGRTPEENARVGGEPASQHLVDLAVDVTGDAEGFANEAEVAGLVVLDQGTHFHIQAFPASARIVERLFPELI